jgi:putative DNA primase/helicase
MHRRSSFATLAGRRRPRPAVMSATAEPARAKRQVTLTLPPLTAEHPGSAAQRLLGRPPNRLWRYATAADATAFFVARWNNPIGRKSVRTLSWDVHEGWCTAAWPNGRPLFGLPALLARPLAPVVVCEGEIATEASATIFPDFVATTSSCGACEAARTDWIPLAGRAVLVWPDFDEAGCAFARQVALLLIALGCPVRIVDPPVLFASRISGGVPPPKWDAADAARTWSNLADLRVAALAAAQLFP